MDATPRTLLEAVTYFADADRAHAYAVKSRWPNGVACPRQGCGSASVQAIATRKIWRCKECKKQFSVKVGTIFEDSPIPFTKWLPAMWLLANTKNGTSSYELGRGIGVTQRTAWFMFHRIRASMKDDTPTPLFGEVEADETFVGGRIRATGLAPSGHHRVAGGPAAGKTTVFGIVQRAADSRTSRVRAHVVPNHKASSLLPHLYQNVLPGSVLYTDSLRSYRQADRDYVHHFIDHAVKYVQGRVHTNTIENFWSCLKRTLHGTYIAPRAFHLAAYVDEQVFRFNARDGKDADRFVAVLKGADGRRVTRAALTSAHPNGARRCRRSSLRHVVGRRSIRTPSPARATGSSQATASTERRGRNGAVGGLVCLDKRIFRTYRRAWFSLSARDPRAGRGAGAARRLRFPGSDAARDRRFPRARN